MRANHPDSPDIPDGTTPDGTQVGAMLRSRQVF
ncbi:hypothetical protein LMG23992_01213 [Cupriavidus laharis]|uniref:Uncharacterized protein n=1 Tax=Cupriavidus laharis TaxID=151654 RepID=A0ABM8WMJ3_9BURK|nr:hypothetical protein LMG23992_01213 [Cupriavidus laharis]